MPNEKIKSKTTNDKWEIKPFKRSENNKFSSKEKLFEFSNVHKVRKQKRSD